MLDNFEHLLDAAPEVASLVASCLNLTVLATSRAPLRVRGEREYPVPPLKLPDISRTAGVEEVSKVAAVELFAQRAREASPAFELNRQNAALPAPGWVTARVGACRRPGKVSEPYGAPL